MNTEVVNAQIESITPLTDSILQILLTPAHYIDYHAGQYLQILLADEVLSYSIANAPLGSHKYELHLRHSTINQPNRHLLTEIKQQGKINIRLPYGDCHIDKLPADKPLLFIAGGTGFAPIKAMIEQLLANGDKRSFALFWGARSPSDLYMDDRVRQWQTHVKHFRYFSLGTSTKEKLASEVLNHYKDDLKNWQVIIAGPFDMVCAIRDSLTTHGVSPTQLHSDAFSFEKRSQ